MARRQGEQPVLRVGLTGGIACGKSAVADMLAARGAHVLKADELGHRLMRPGEPAYEQIVLRFGREILDGNGSINRGRLAAIAFAPGTPRIEELNRIIHPPVVAEQDRWMRELGQREPHAVAVIEAALMLEAGARSHFDCIVVVVCRPEQKVERLAKRLEVDLETARPGSQPALGGAMARRGKGAPCRFHHRQQRLAGRNGGTGGAPDGGVETASSADRVTAVHVAERHSAG